MSAYSAKGILLTIGVSIGLFILSALGSLRYLKKVTISELLKEEAVHKSEKHPVLWCILLVLMMAGMLGSFSVTYHSMMEAFHSQEGIGLFFLAGAGSGDGFSFSPHSVQNTGGNSA